MTKKKCFIIMPISTPENWRQKYSDDENHFEHVLDHLLIPSLKKVDLEPIPPITKGSEIIQGEIIKNIETADLVLCDISILNPNVFFELGIRTALNKPVCLIKDDVTAKIPFDTSIINYHGYLSSLNPWTLTKEIDSLANHIKESLKRSNDTNSLWKYFSLSSTAHPVEPEKGIEGKVGLLTMQIEALRKQLKNKEMYSNNYRGANLNNFIDKKPPIISRSIVVHNRDVPYESKYKLLINEITELAKVNRENINKLEIDKENNIKIHFQNSPSFNFANLIYDKCLNDGKTLELFDSDGNIFEF